MQGKHRLACSGEIEKTEMIKNIMKGQFLFIYNPMKNIWNKLEKTSRTGQDWTGQEKFDIYFACFLTATAKF